MYFGGKIMEIEVISSVLRAVFFTFVFISVLLLIGTYLRAKVKLLQKLFLPASVIGGFVGLLLGPTVLNKYAILPTPENWINIASLLPGLLIVPVVASVPLGMKLSSKSNKANTKEKSGSKNILMMFLILAILLAVQSLFGVFIARVFNTVFRYEDIYATFGMELPAGFAGGHGTAGIVGSILQSLSQPYWHTAQGVTTTTATVGLVSGILIGIVMINIAVRRGNTELINTESTIAEDVQTGVQKDIHKQKSIGKETTNAASIDSISFHFALILMVSGLSFALTYVFNKYNILVLKFIPVWAYAILIMYVVWGLMVKWKLDWIVDEKTKTKISTTLTEFAIVAAIISMPLKTVFTFIIPLSIMMIGGLLLTMALSYYLSKKIFQDYWFERSMTIFGTNTGVFLTGLLLLTMVDPKMKSPVLKDYSFAYSINSVISFIFIPLSFGILINYGWISGLVFYGLLILFSFTLLLYIYRKNKQEKVY